MGNENARIERTNAKLRFAKVYLDILIALEKNKEIGGNDKDRAHQESFLFHLLGSLDSFFFEISHAYKIEFEGFVNLYRLIENSKKKHIKCFEGEFILKCKQDENHWLYTAYQLRNYLTHNSHIPRNYHLDGSNHRKVFFTVPNTGKIIELDFVELFQNWYKEMMNFISELRTKMGNLEI